MDNNENLCILSLNLHGNVRSQGYVSFLFRLLYQMFGNTNSSLKPLQADDLAIDSALKPTLDAPVKQAGGSSEIDVWYESDTVWGENVQYRQTQTATWIRCFPSAWQDIANKLSLDCTRCLLSYIGGPRHPIWT